MVGVPFRILYHLLWGTAFCVERMQEKLKMFSVSVMSTTKFEIFIR